MVDEYLSCQFEVPEKLNELLEAGALDKSLDVLITHLTATNWPSLEDYSTSQYEARLDEEVIVVTNKPSKLLRKETWQAKGQSYYKAKTIYRSNSWQDKSMILADSPTKGKRLLVENSLFEVEKMPIFQPPEFIEPPKLPSYRRAKTPETVFLRALLGSLKLKPEIDFEMNIERCFKLINGLFSESGGMDRSDIAKVLKTR